MANPLRGEGTAEFEDEDEDGKPFTRQLHLVMNNEAWLHVERVDGESYLEIVMRLLTCEMQNRAPLLGDARAVLYGATREKHPELTVAECRDLIVDHGAEINPALGQAMRGAIRVKAAEPGEAKPGARPAKKARAGTGTAS